MAELAQKRKVRAPHRRAAMKKIQEVKTLLAAIAGGDAPDIDKLTGLRATLTEKLAYLRQLDREIERLIEDDEALDTEVQQSEDVVQEISIAIAGLIMC